ncbi:alkaline ceramidase 1 isoform X4 [Hippopotamus amphibius kiboko]|uniref:alkaline ceramidase 1 isoform X4 n=1 Tax=Hippopotamus amphibius kiboko TaxID=575201 RepID=UPI0025971838|nr:alkaline ceramidase 1 isoform X4 [Hippopotamus amphibius kiboko]
MDFENTMLSERNQTQETKQYVTPAIGNVQNRQIHRGREWFSNVTFFIFGPLMMFLMNAYVQKRSRYIYIIFILFTVVGLFSMYFHMTLSFLGQMLDEISILWLLAGGYSIWLPRCYFPTFLRKNRASNKDLRHLIEVAVVLWAFAFTSWISDRFLCSFWQWINFSYLHSIWHVLISITFPYGIVTMAMVDALYEMPDKTVKVCYWPRDTWPVGLPYLEISDDNKSC